MPRGAVADRHQQKGRQVFVAVSLAFETGGALDNEGKSVRIVECSSVGPSILSTLSRVSSPPSPPAYPSALSRSPKWVVGRWVVVKGP